MKRGNHIPRIRLVNGRWYAFGKDTKPGRLLLVPAISFCNRQNCKQKRKPA